MIRIPSGRWLLWTLLSVLALISIPPDRAAATTTIAGDYVGIADSAGATLSLDEEDGRVVGRFARADGSVFDVNGRRTGDAAQGALTHDDGSAFFYLEPRSFGLKFEFIPVAEGEPNLDDVRAYSLVPKGPDDAGSITGEPVSAPEPGQAEEPVRTVEVLMSRDDRGVNLADRGEVLDHAPGGPPLPLSRPGGSFPRNAAVPADHPLAAAARLPRANPRR